MQGPREMLTGGCARGMSRAGEQPVDVEKCGEGEQSVSGVGAVHVTDAVGIGH